MRKLFCLLSLIMLSPPAMALQNFCPTKIQCPVNTLCTCSTGASTYSRYFYFEFPLEKGTHYECTLKTSKFNIDTLDSVANPNGVERQGPSSPRFPLIFSVDATKMDIQEGKMSVKFLVPPSDMADDFQGICKVSE